jgi:sodium-independent sulfate anion transporter 11
VFTAMEYFMSSVRKASALYPGIIVVIDMSHVSAADFTTAYVILAERLFEKKGTLANELNVMHTQGFDNMIKSLQKHGHKLVLTKTKPEILPILSGIGCDLHVHSDGTDLDVLLKGIL